MILINLKYILSLNTIIFLIGMLGLILNRKNILILIISIELMLLAVNLNFITFSIYLDDIIGQIFILFILTVSAAESSIGLAILSSYYNLKNTILIEKFNVKFKG
jgi:NADH-quinone oxidoreductase subunit K